MGFRSIKGAIKRWLRRVGIVKNKYGLAPRCPICDDPLRVSLRLAELHCLECIVRLRLPGLSSYERGNFTMHNPFGVNGQTCVNPKGHDGPCVSVNDYVDDWGVRNGR